MIKYRLCKIFKSLACCGRLCFVGHNCIENCKKICYNKNEECI